MLGKLKHFLFGFNKVAGVEIILPGEGSDIQIKLVLLSLNKNLLNIERVETLVSLEDLKKIITSDTPISLSITGKGIITRKVAEAEISDQNNFIDKIFPNANASEFYLQKYTGIENFISIIRKNKVDEIIEKIETLDFNVISISLGPFAVLAILPILNNEKADLFLFSGHLLSFKNGLLYDYKLSGQESLSADIQIDKESIKEGMLISYASAFEVLSGSNQASIEEEAYLKSKAEFKQRKIFKSLSKIAAFLLFFILVLNIYFHFTLTSENESLKREESRYEAMLFQLADLEKQVKEKENFLKEAGWNGLSRTSYCSDRLASTVPSNVKLTEMSVNPINDKLSKTERRLIFSSGFMKLTGTCHNPTDLNPWIKKMKNFEWVKEVAIQNYIYNEKNKEGVFNIEVTVK